MVAKVTPRWGDFGHFYEIFVFKSEKLQFSQNKVIYFKNDVVSI